jgi:hypothetical protein
MTMGRAPSRRQTPGTHYRGVDQCEHFGLYPNGKRCHGCGAVLRDAADEHTIFIRVTTGIVFLHPRCAVELGRRLVREGTRALAEPDEAW